jgi:hypothetical protein
MKFIAASSSPSHKRDTTIASASLGPSSLLFQQKVKKIDEKA